MGVVLRNGVRHPRAVLAAAGVLETFKTRVVLPVGTTPRTAEPSRAGLAWRSDALLNFWKLAPPFCHLKGWMLLRPLCDINDGPRHTLGQGYLVPKLKALLPAFFGRRVKTYSQYKRHHARGDFRNVSERQSKREKRDAPTECKHAAHCRFPRDFDGHMVARVHQLHMPHMGHMRALDGLGQSRRRGFIWGGVRYRSVNHGSRPVREWLDSE